MGVTVPAAWLLHQPQRPLPASAAPSPHVLQLRSGMGRHTQGPQLPGLVAAPTGATLVTARKRRACMAATSSPTLRSLSARSWEAA